MFFLNERILLNIIEYKLFAMVAIKQAVIISTCHRRLNVNLMLWHDLHELLFFRWKLNESNTDHDILLIFKYQFCQDIPRAYEVQRLATVANFQLSDFSEPKLNLIQVLCLGY